MPATLPPPETLISQLIATPSVSSTTPALDHGNGEVCALLAGWLEAAGFRVSMSAVPGQPGKFNVTGTLGDGDGGLVLSGHTDTVPFDDGAWQSDPFVATERDGRLYGLGTADMKSFLALAVTAASRFRAAELRRPLVIVGTADEETGMSGARALSDEGRPLGRYVVIGEPTDLTPIRAHKGILMDSVLLTGRSGHSSNPALGVSALDGMTDVMDELKALRAEMALQWQDRNFGVPTPTLNLGVIRGGDSVNRICARCELQYDVRLLPGMAVRQWRDTIRGRIAARLDGSGLDVHFHSLFDGIDPLDTAADSAIVTVAERMTGRPSGAVDFGTEGPFFSAMGTEALILGPGSIAVAHQPDEYLPLSALAPTLDLLERLIRHFCVDAAPRA